MGAVGSQWFKSFCVFLKSNSALVLVPVPKLPIIHMRHKAHSYWIIWNAAKYNFKGFYDLSMGKLQKASIFSVKVLLNTSLLLISS